MPPPPGGWQQQAPKPGVIPLRPLGLGEILDGSITAMRTYPRQMLGLAAIVSVAINLLVFGVMLYLYNETTVFYVVVEPGMTEADIQLEQLWLATLALVPTALLSSVATMVLNGMLTIVMGKAVLGQPVTAAEAWRMIKPRFWSLLGLSLLYVLIVFGVFIVLAVPLALVVSVLGIVVAAVPAAWLYVMLSLSSTALILEGATVGRALSRSRLLVQNAWWRTFGILLLTAVIAGILEFVVNIPFTLIDGGLDTLTGTGPAPGLTVSLLLSALSGIIASVLTLPFTSGVTTLIYIDRRMRREGMDIELARQAGQAPNGPTAW